AAGRRDRGVRAPRLLDAPGRHLPREHSQPRAGPQARVPRGRAARADRGDERRLARRRGRRAAECRGGSGVGQVERDQREVWRATPQPTRTSRETRPRVRVRPGWVGHPPHQKAAMRRRLIHALLALTLAATTGPGFATPAPARYAATQAAPSQPSFDAHFTSRTMRLDYFHTGGRGTEIVSLDRVVADGPWPGSRTRLVDDTDLGKYRFRV